MEVLVRYCGGCNPRYDRSEVLELLREEFPDVEFIVTTSHEERTGDAVLVLAGCTAACADYSSVSSPHAPIIVASRAAKKKAIKELHRIKSALEADSK
ncbi:MAG: hypothetical protein GX975_02670 [Clostridiales bacterium]|nr:hypothetical protein [Clostridiales bacterium]